MNGLNGENGLHVLFRAEEKELTQELGHALHPLMEALSVRILNNQRLILVMKVFVQVKYMSENRSFQVWLNDFLIQNIDNPILDLYINVETEKQLGSWTNDGECIAKGNDPACGPGHQRQLRTCIDGTKDQCTAADTVQTISCLDAGTALPDCIIEKRLGNWVNDGTCIATGDDPSCGPGNQTQKRTCTDGSTDKCNDSDLEQVIPCSEAGTALPDCG